MGTGVNKITPVPFNSNPFNSNQELQKHLTFQAVAPMRDAAAEGVRHLGAGNGARKAASKSNGDSQHGVFELEDCAAGMRQSLGRQPSRNLDARKIHVGQTDD